jgi:hypothetical protein
VADDISQLGLGVFAGAEIGIGLCAAEGEDARGAGAVMIDGVVCACGADAEVPYERRDKRSLAGFIGRV